MPIFNALLKRIRENDSMLRHLNLSGQKLIDEDILSLIEALKTNTHLSAISFCYFTNKMPHENADSNVVYLPEHTPNHLYNRLTARSAKLLADCKTLQWLDLTGNPIGDEGAIALAQSNSLRCLRLVDCQITMVGAKAFLRNLVLHDIWLQGNRFDQWEDNWIDKIDRQLTNNKVCGDEKAQLALNKQREDAALEQKVLEALDIEDINQLKVLIPKLPHGVHTRLADGYGMLHYTLDQKKLNALCWLLSAGALIEEHERDYTPLFTAAENGDYELVKILLRHGSNMTGEFYFNNETALSISMFKANNAFHAFWQASPLPLPLQPTKEINEFVRYWDAFINEQKDDTPAWVRVAKTPPEMLKQTTIVHKYVNTLLRMSSWNDKLGKDENFKAAANYIRIFQLLHDKQAIIKRTNLINAPHYFQAMEDEKIITSYRLQIFPASPGKAWDATDRKTVEQAVAALNAELKNHKEQDIRWTEHPRFFIAQYRCIHYYRNAFGPNQLRDHIATRHLNRIMPAPAVFAMSSMTPQAHQLLRETQVVHDRIDLIETFERFRQSGEIKAHGKTFANADAALQEKLSNDYRGSMDDIKRKVNVACEILFDKKAISYPHCATSDLLQHALCYGFGKKKVAGFAQHLLDPEYNAAGKPTNSILGKVYIGLFSPLEIAQHRARHVLGAHNRKLINLKDTVAPERETSLPGGVLAGQFFYEAILEVPDLSAWNPGYVERFGLSQEACNDYKKRLSTNREKVVDDLLAYLIKFKEKELLTIAQQEAQRRGGILIYCHNDREYGLEPEKIRASDREPYVSQSERALMRTTGAQRFASTANMEIDSSNDSASSSAADSKSERGVDLTEWYTEDKINKLLKCFLPNTILRIAQTQMEHKNLLQANLQQAMQKVAETHQPAVIPIHLHDNHWSGLVIKLKSDGHLQVIYNDPKGNSLDKESAAADIIRQITSKDSHAEIIDLSLKQQDNDNDCGPFTVDNLVKLATKDTNGKNLDALKRLLNVPMDGSAKVLREQQHVLLQSNLQVETKAHGGSKRKLIASVPKEGIKNNEHVVAKDSDGDKLMEDVKETEVNKTDKEPQAKRLKSDSTSGLSNSATPALLLSVPLVAVAASSGSPVHTGRATHPAERQQVEANKAASPLTQPPIVKK